MQVKWFVGQNRSNCFKYSMQRIHPLVNQTQHLKSSFKSSVPDARRSMDRSSSALHTCQHTDNSSSGNRIGGQKKILPADSRGPCEIKWVYRVKKLNRPVPPLGPNSGVRRIPTNYHINKSQINEKQSKLGEQDVPLLQRVRLHEMVGHRQKKS
jgi:hypothetical protein